MDSNQLASIDERLNGLRVQVETTLGSKVVGMTTHFQELTCQVAIDDIVAILLALRDPNGGGFSQLTELTAVDYPQRPKRFDLVYQLLSVGQNARIRLTAPIADGSIAPTVSHLFASALWSEREVWDMFGIFFSGHADLRRLLTDYGFEGHPLRKDFPLTGTVETRYDAELKRVVYEPVSLQQEYRNFDFASPWTGSGGASGSAAGTPINLDNVSQDAKIAHNANKGAGDG